jgi:hypothetical protein
MAIFRRIANLMHRSSVDREIEAELESHIAMRIDENMPAACRLKMRGAMLCCASAIPPQHAST